MKWWKMGCKIWEKCSSRKNAKIQSGKAGQGHCQYFLKYLKYNDDVVAYKS